MIEGYSFGRITVDGKSFSRDLIIFRDRVRADWWRVTGHEVCADDVKEIVEAAPDVVVIGTGAGGLVKVLPDAEEALRAVGARIIAEPTEAACRTLNRLLEDGEDVVAALHLTC